MRVSEIIRITINDLEQIEQPEQPVDELGYADSDIKRFQQISKLAGSSTYTTQPNEQYADVESVTNQAGADGWQGTKEPEDIRGNSFRIYPSKDRP